MQSKIAKNWMRKNEYLHLELEKYQIYVSALNEAKLTIHRDKVVDTNETHNLDGTVDFSDGPCLQKSSVITAKHEKHLIIIEAAETISSKSISFLGTTKEERNIQSLDSENQINISALPQEFEKEDISETPYEKKSSSDFPFVNQTYSPLDLNVSIITKSNLHLPLIINSESLLMGVVTAPIITGNEILSEVTEWPVRVDITFDPSTSQPNRLSLNKSVDPMRLFPGEQPVNGISGPSKIDSVSALDESKYSNPLLATEKNVAGKPTEKSLNISGNWTQWDPYLLGKHLFEGSVIKIAKNEISPLIGKSGEFYKVVLFSYMSCFDFGGQSLDEAFRYTNND
jgi:hypothetical protein